MMIREIPLTRGGSVAMSTAVDAKPPSTAELQI